MPRASLPLAFGALGEGPPVVVLHGLFGSGTNWRSVAKRLADRHRVLLVDARNHGASPHAATMRYAEMAADVRALMDAEGIEQATLLGHSMGGKTAMTLALQTPERVGRLAVVDIAPAPSPADHGPLIAAMQSLDLGALTRRSEVDALLAAAVPDAGLRAFLLQNVVAEGSTLRWRLNLAALETSLPTLLSFEAPAADARYTGPTLFIRGERSEYLRDSHRPAIGALFPDARLVSVPRSGHWVHAENPEGFLAELLAFLAEGDE